MQNTKRRTRREPIDDETRFTLTEKGWAALLDTSALIAAVRLSNAQETAPTQTDAQAVATA